MTGWPWSPKQMAETYRLFHYMPGYQRRLLIHWEVEGYPRMDELRKEIARGEKADKSAGRAPQAGRGEAPLALQTSSEHEGEIPSMGSDLLAGGDF